MGVVLGSAGMAGPRIPAGTLFPVRVPTTMVIRGDNNEAYAMTRAPVLGVRLLFPKVGHSFLQFRVREGPRLRAQDGVAGGRDAPGRARPSTLRRRHSYMTSLAFGAVNRGVPVAEP